MFCKKCGENVNDGVKFCPKCGDNMLQEENGGEKSLNEIALKTNTNDNKKTIKDTLMKNKKILAGVALVAVIAIVGFFVFSGGGVDKDTVKSDLVGKIINIEKMSLKLTEDNIKSFKIEENEESKNAGVKMTKVKGTVEIDNGKVKVSAPFSMEYMKLGGDEWEFLGGSVNGSDKTVTFEMIEKINDEKIKAALSDKRISGIKLENESIKEAKVKINNQNESGTFCKATIDFGYKGTFVEKSMEAMCEFTFNGEEWEMTKGKMGMSDLAIKAAGKEVPFDTIKKELSVIAPEYGLDVYGTGAVFSIGMDSITELNDFHVELTLLGFMKEPGYSITGKIKGNDKYITYEGDLKGTVGQDSKVRFVVKDATVSMKMPEAADFSKNLKDNYIFFKKDNFAKNELIKSNETDFKMESVLVGAKDKLKFYAFGTLSHGEFKNDPVTIIGKYKNGFKVTEIRSSTLDNYDTEYSKEAIEKAIEQNLK